MKKISLVFFALFIYSNAFSTRYYVNVNATGNGTGSSWANAFTDLQTALSSSFFGDEIWVASGVYKPTTSTTRSVSFVLKDGVNIYGSFAGTETSISQRDIANNLSTLSGDIGQLGHAPDNSYHVLKGNNLSSNIEVNGFRIVSGYSNSTGGGLEIENNLNGNLLLKNCYFYNNRAYNYAGGIYLYSANLTIENCEFINNDASTGGAIYNGAGNGGGLSTLIIKDCIFKNNIAYSGACLANADPYRDLLIDRCVFTNNFSDNSIISIIDFDDAKILNSTIIGNRVDGFSSNILYVRTFSSTEDFELTNCTIADNFNSYNFNIQEEIILLDELQFEINNCIIYGNTPYQGKQINTTATARNSLVEGGYTGGINIITQNPSFSAPKSSATSNFDATQYDYTLSNISPAINAGDNNFVDLVNHPFDLNLASRIQAITVDMGAYESNVAASSISPKICIGESWVTGTSTYTTTGTYYDTLVAFNGNDSVITTNLTVYNPVSISVSPTICAGESWVTGTSTYTTTGTYVDTLSTSNGCDSVVTTNLTIYNLITSSVSPTICTGESWSIGTSIYTTTGTYIDTLIAANGCDSLVTTNLTVSSLAASSSSQSPTICTGESWTVGASTYNITGTYIDTLVAANGCDSVVTTNLTINSLPDTSITQTDSILTANNPTATYQWIDCATMMPITGETNQSFSITTDGNYAVEVTANGCSDTSACFSVITSSIFQPTEVPVSIYPNPNTGEFSIQFSPSLTGNTSIEIIGVDGRSIYEKSFEDLQFLKNKTVRLQNIASGVYFVKLWVGKKLSTTKLIIKD